MSFLTLEQVRKTYADGTEAVKGIELECAEGEFVVLLGPSGCGKTTTLRMVAGLEQVTAGRIWVAGEDITSRPPAARDVGFVFQFYALYPHMRVRDNIAFPLESMGLSQAEIGEKVDEVSGRLGLKALSRLYPEQLSGGDQQRVALARAMVRTPRLYLMDEPLGTLDADRRLALRELIRVQQVEMGVTTIYVTHDQEEAMSLADRVVVMEGGRIRQSASPAAVYDNPADLFVAHFVGSPGMNFIRGEIGERRFAAAGLRLPVSARLRSGPTVLGVRPEFVRPDPAGPLQAEVLMDEYLGASRIAHLQTACGRMVMRSQGRTGYTAGDRLALGFDLARVLYYDPHTGENLVPR